jgi:hypothetical protein
MPVQNAFRLKKSTKVNESCVIFEKFGDASEENLIRPRVLSPPLYQLQIARGGFVNANVR